MIDPIAVARLRVVPCTIKAAQAYVREVHRHHRPPQGGLFAVGVSVDGALVGVAIVGRPVARMLLYGAARRAARALGYRRLITYTLATEPGTSLRAAGWQCDGEAGGGSWSRPSRDRKDHHPTAVKVRWQVTP